MPKIGIIGGSGLDNPKILNDEVDVNILTPYGNTSSLIKTGKIAGVEVDLISRHGREHTVTPTNVNYRANIFALKEIGCTHILATTAVGSLRLEIERGDLVILDQFIDWTRHRINTYFDEFKPGKMGHTGMADAFDKTLRQLLINTCNSLNLKHHEHGTVVTIEGPRFSTRAESKMFRTFGADVINMTLATETALAKEIGIPYAAIAMSTDYDCWKEDEEPVTWEGVMEIFNANVEKVTKLLITAIPQIKD